jgi:hypothetical protein
VLNIEETSAVVAAAWKLMFTPLVSAAEARRS